MSTLQEDYLEAARVFHWATKDDYVLWFTGHTGRDIRTERTLPALVKKGKLASAKYGRKMIYTTPERMRVKNMSIPFNDQVTNKASVHLLQPYHGLSCTRCLVRFVRSFPDCEVLGEQVFKNGKYGVVPEWGIKYPAGKFLLFEFSSEYQATKPGAISAKIGRYRKSTLSDATILFVLDIPKLNVELLVKDLKPEGDILFTDYQTFLSVPLGKQLSTPIYIWGQDGQTYPLGHDR